MVIDVMVDWVLDPDVEWFGTASVNPIIPSKFVQ